MNNSESIIMKTNEHHVITWRNVMKTSTPLTDLGLFFLAFRTPDRKANNGTLRNKNVPMICKPVIRHACLLTRALQRFNGIAGGILWLESGMISCSVISGAARIPESCYMRNNSIFRAAADFLSPFSFHWMQEPFWCVQCSPPVYQSLLCGFGASQILRHKWQWVLHVTSLPA